jgi:hypothetical protein
MPKKKTQIESPKAVARAPVADESTEQGMKPPATQPASPSRATETAGAERMNDSEQPAGAAGRARMMKTAQQTVGNTRVGQMTGASIQKKEKDGAATPDKKKEKKKAPPKITTPLDPDTKINPAGAAELDVGGVAVTIKPDTKSKDMKMKGEAKTRIKLKWDPPSYESRSGMITKVDPVTPPMAKIQTTYGPGATSETKSSYGKGTTKEDIEAGETTLGHHEGSHGADYLLYLKENPVPQFQGKVGMTQKEYDAAIKEYDGAMKQYQSDLEEYSRQHTDCVGDKADFCKD